MTTFLSEEYPTAIYSKHFKFNYGHALIEPLLEWANNSDDSSEIELSAESLNEYFTLISFATYNPIEDEYIIDNSGCFIFKDPANGSYYTTYFLSSALVGVLNTEHLRHRINFFQKICRGLTMAEGLNDDRSLYSKNTRLYEIHENYDLLNPDPLIIQRCLLDSAFCCYTSTQWISVSKDQEHLFYTKDWTGSRIIDPKKLQNIFRCFKNDEYEPFNNWLQPEEFGFCCLYND